MACVVAHERLHDENQASHMIRYGGASTSAYLKVSPRFRSVPGGAATVRSTGTRDTHDRLLRMMKMRWAAAASAQP